MTPALALYALSHLLPSFTILLPVSVCSPGPIHIASGGLFHSQPCLHNYWRQHSASQLWWANRASCSAEDPYQFIPADTWVYHSPPHCCPCTRHPSTGLHAPSNSPSPSSQHYFHPTHPSRPFCSTANSHSPAENPPCDYPLSFY